MRRYGVSSDAQYATRAAALAGSRPHTPSVRLGAAMFSTSLQRLAGFSARAAARAAFLGTRAFARGINFPYAWFHDTLRTGVRPGAFADGVYGGVGSLEHIPGIERARASRMPKTSDRPRYAKRLGSFAAFSILVREAEAEAGKPKQVRVRKPKAAKAQAKPRVRKPKVRVVQIHGKPVEIRSIRRVQASPSPVVVARIPASVQATPAPLQVAALPRSERRAARAAAHRQAVATA